MKKIILSSLIFLLTSGTFANSLHTWSQPVLGTSTIWELHVIKNDKNKTHTKYRCSQLQRCWHEFENIRHQSNNFNNLKSVWMERLDQQLYLIK